MGEGRDIRREPLALGVAILVLGVAVIEGAASLGVVVVEGAASLLLGVEGAASLLLGVEGANLLVTAVGRPPGVTADLTAAVTADLRPGKLPRVDSWEPVSSLVPGVLKRRLCLAPFPGVAELGRDKLLPCLARAGLGACMSPASDPLMADPITGFTTLPTFLTLDIRLGTVVLLAGVRQPRTKEPFTAGIDNPVLILLLTF